MRPESGESLVGTSTRMNEDVVGAKWVRPTAVLLFLLGLAVLAIALTPPRFTPPVSDFGRDLIGAEAARSGIDPYQQLGSIADLLPDVVVPSEARDYWVAHTPFSLAAARGTLEVFGQSSESVFSVVLVIAMGVLFFYAWWKWGRRSYVGLALVGVLALIPGSRDDVQWLQGAAFAALALAAVLELALRDLRTWTLVLLSALVAWKPWFAPLALFLPRSRSALRDATWVGAGAVGLNLVVLPVVGGVEALRQWLTVAMPSNAADYLSHPGNLSLTGRMLGSLPSILLLAFVCLVLVWKRSRLSGSDARAVAAVAILGLSPLAWPWYWIGLTPAFMNGVSITRVKALTLCLLPMTFMTLTGRGDLLRPTSALAIFLVLFSVVTAKRQIRSRRELAGLMD